MAIEELLRLVAPPEHPVEVGDVTQWAGVEQQLGTRLPQDYSDLATHYGSGLFVGLLGMWILNPFAPWYLNQLRWGSDFLRDRRGLHARYGVPYGVFPDQPGWLLWGQTDIGDDLCWVTEGEPEAWPLLLISDHCRHFQQLQMPMTTFLAGLLTGSVQAFFAIEGGLAHGQPVQFVPRRHSQPAPAAEPSVVSLWDKEAGGFRSPWEGEWFPPDELGRPTGARVVLGPGRREYYWNGFAAEGFTVYPDWWHELPPPRRRWQRGQLLGWRLGGPAGTALHNMIPLTRRAQMSMWAFERSVAVSVHSGSRKSCTVTTTYEGTNRYPSAVRVREEYMPGFSADGSGVDGWTIDNT